MPQTYSFKPHWTCSPRMDVTIEGIKCGPKPTSCPDQLAQGLKDIIDGANAGGTARLAPSRP